MGSAERIGQDLPDESDRGRSDAQARAWVDWARENQLAAREYSRWLREQDERGKKDALRRPHFPLNQNYQGNGLHRENGRWVQRSGPTEAPRWPEFMGEDESGRIDERRLAQSSRFKGYIRRVWREQRDRMEPNDQAVLKEYYSGKKTPTMEEFAVALGKPSANAARQELYRVRQRFGRQIVAALEKDHEDSRDEDHRRVIRKAIDAIDAMLRPRGGGSDPRGSAS